MAMVVKNNMGAVRTLNTLNKNSSALSKSLAKLSSGMKINTAQDDASGYAISERMRVQIHGLEQDIQNTQNDISLMKTAEGAVSGTIEILKALKEKAINAANDSNTDADRQTIQKEVDQFIDQIDDNALVTFNGKYLIDGSKNFRSENGTKTAFTNMALHTGTTAVSALTLLRSRNGDSLEIMETDRIVASVVINGQTYTTSFNVRDTNTGTIAVFNDIFTALNITTRDAGVGNVFGRANFDTSLSRGFDDEDNLPEMAVNAIPAPGGGFGRAVQGLPGIFEHDRNATDDQFRGHQLHRMRDGAFLRTGLYDGPVLIQNGAAIGKNAAAEVVRTSDGTTGFTVTASTVGYGVGGGQISGLNISIIDSTGNVKKAANAALDAFNLSIREMNVNREDNSLNFHVGTEANVAIKVGLTDMRSEALGLKGSTGTKLKITTKEFANAAISVMDTALIKALDEATNIGAIEARLEYTKDNLTTSSENVQNAESTIRDADMAKEMTEYTKNNVLLQAAQSMLAQANQNLSSVLSLLQ